MIRDGRGRRLVRKARVFDRFTDRARKVMGYARQEAERLGHGYVGTEHVLLGLVKEGSGVAANVLEKLGVDLDGARAEVEKRVEKGSAENPSQIPFSRNARKVLDYAVDEARGLGHRYVGTEHLLLGLLRQEKGKAAEVLLSLGVKLEDVRREVVELLGVEPGKGPALGLSEEAARLMQVKQEKAAAVAAQDFELAARLRDEEEALRQRRFVSVHGVSPRVRRALECAEEEARREGGRTIEIGHLLRGIERVAGEESGGKADG
jgi:ATP-dependent Clp protease ATP-binding subunit ClpA